MKNSLNTILIGITVIITAWIFTHAFKNRDIKNDIISVTGMGTKDFTADLIVWNASFFRKNKNLKEAYAELDKDKENVKSYLIGKGLKENEFIFSSVDISEETEDIRDDDGNTIRTMFIGYKLTQFVQIESKNVNKIEEVSRQVSELINTGVELNSASPDYYYTKLAELKIEMIAEATKDANLRAKKIAENSGGSLGKLRNAKMGVFQIVAQNSSEDFSSGGTFNTSSKQKTATITIKLDYESD
ncbi:MAG: SIMPL domain-containing protein [Raineya sp.]|jgi:hypothetical protein|nr:SIMPL domain-containing protein [Raineya sp.]